MHRLTYALAIVSIIPGLIIIPLSPFAHLIVNTPGLRPGLLHEHLFTASLFTWPPLLIISLLTARILLKRAHHITALIAAATPLTAALWLVWLLTAGGVQLK